MKIGLFILSVAAFISALFFLVCDLVSKYSLSHFVYIMLLIVILINSVAGIFMTWPVLTAKKNN